MIQALLDFDKWLFLLLNGLHFSTLDTLMVGISSRELWIPLYIYLLYILIKRFKFQSIYIIIMTVLLITLCDQFSVQLFKNVFMRLRPCHEPELQGLVHLVNDHCGGQYGFVSSHATNVFGLAVFLGAILNRTGRYWLSMLLLLWAAVVSYSRIYLGVHYPFDIIGGALLGMFLARLMLLLLKAIDKRFSLNIHHQ